MLAKLAALANFRNSVILRKITAKKNYNWFPCFTSKYDFLYHVEIALSQVRIYLPANVKLSYDRIPQALNQWIW